MKYRGFISVEVGGLSKILEFGEDLKRTKVRMKLVEADNIHMTLKFLGDVDERKNERILEAMHRAVEGFQAFEMTLKGAGAFPGMNNIRVVWIGAEGAEALSEIAARLNSYLKKVGFPPEERGFTPHITIARVKDRRHSAQLSGLIESHGDTEFGVVRVVDIQLKRSFLTNEGPVYTTMGVARLVG
ncbi:MAG: RNA 2',3'-cyclic phosphodiesterase [Candidatus Thermoplasmatota archaeon]